MNGLLRDTSSASEISTKDNMASDKEGVRSNGACTFRILRKMPEGKAKIKGEMSRSTVAIAST